MRCSKYSHVFEYVALSALSKPFIRLATIDFTRHSLRYVANCETMSYSETRRANALRAVITQSLLKFGIACFILLPILGHAWKSTNPA